jgi:hypothetical protein
MPSRSPIDLVVKIDEMKSCEQRFILWPRQWQTYAQSHKWKHQRLEESKAGFIMLCIFGLRKDFMRG